MALGIMVMIGYVHGMAAKGGSFSPNVPNKWLHCISRSVWQFLEDFQMKDVDQVIFKVTQDEIPE